MLLKYRINNYKSINEEMELDLNTNIFLICGKEKSGKTSIIDSMVFAISHMISPAQYILKDKIFYYKNFNLNFDSKNRESAFNMTLELNNVIYNYGLSLKKDELNSIVVDSEYLEIDKKLLFKRSNKDIQLDDLVKNYEIEKYIDDSIPVFSTLIISKKNDEINNLYNYFKNMVVIESSIHSLIIKDNIIKLLNKEKKLILRILSKFDKNYKDFFVNKKNIISIYKNGMEVDFINESSTIQNILLYMPQIINAIKHGNMIIIDDLDKRFNSKLVDIIENLLLDKNINKNNTQLIATINNKNYVGENRKILWI